MQITYRECMLDVQINEKVKLLDNINKLFILELPWMQSDALIQPHFALFGIETLYRITGKENTNYAK